MSWHTVLVHSVWWRQHSPISSVHLVVCVCGPAHAVLTPHIFHPRQTLSQSHSLSYRRVMWPFFLLNSCSQSSHYSLALVAVLEDKVNTLSQFAFRCNYKSSLLLCEGEGERVSSLSDEGTVDGFVGEEWGCGGGGWGVRILSDCLQGSNLLRRQVNQSGGSELDGAHIQRRTWVETENAAVAQCGLGMPPPEKAGLLRRPARIMHRDGKGERCFS